MTNSTIIAQPNSMRTRPSGVGPYQYITAPKSAPVVASTTGYMGLIDAPHVRHRPRSTSQLTTGTFSNHDSPRPHDVQRDAGHTTDCLSGSR